MLDISAALRFTQYGSNCVKVSTVTYLAPYDRSYSEYSACMTRLTALTASEALYHYTDNSS